MDNLLLTFISDTHTKHHQIPKQDLGRGDIIFHSGDFTYRGLLEEVEDFLEWFASLDYTYKVFIAGNHELGFEIQKFIVPEKYKERGVYYLQDEEVILKGLKIYGSPWQPEFGGWEFNLPRNGQELTQKWDNIPEDVDVLLTHSPIYGYLDKSREGIHCGCEMLYERVSKITPWIHAWGHIHEAYGQKSLEGRKSREIINASILNRDYQVKHKPVRMEAHKSIKYVDYL